MDKRAIISALIAFVVSAMIGPVVIPFLRRLKMGQTEREDGVQAHLKKAGTPMTSNQLIYFLLVYRLVQF